MILFIWGIFSNSLPQAGGFPKKVLSEITVENPNAEQEDKPKKKKEKEDEKF